MLKKELRKHIREIKRQFSQQQLEELSLPIITRLKSRLTDAKTILAYYSLPDEVDTRQLLDDLVAEGKTVLLPKVVDDENMEIRRYTGRQDLREGILHLMEPVGEPFTAYEDIDIVVVPGLAFDAAGHRLGRGRGYYDRFFTLHSLLFTTIGVCFDFQKVAEVPVDEYDFPVDEVI
ncbi:MAG: 5-formyltetrahydrofolate cyclo-ligase [Prevotella sp.]|nr:5-formyltetrahydrofolate cyclo-ligase [Prevotella sp.]